MLIFVVYSANGRVVPLEVAASDTLAAIKAKVQDKEGIHPELQYFIIAGHDTHDDDMLSDWGLEDGSQIFMVILFKVFVVMEDGNGSITLDVDGYHHIQLVKQLIHSKTGIRPAEQRLIFDGQLLDDAQTLSDCYITPGSVLQLERVEVRFELLVLRVRTGSRFAISVTASYTVGDIKAILEHLIGLPAHSQELHRWVGQRGTISILEDELVDNEHIRSDIPLQLFEKD